MVPRDDGHFDVSSLNVHVPRKITKILFRVRILTCNLPKHKPSHSAKSFGMTPS